MRPHHPKSINHLRPNTNHRNSNNSNREIKEPRVINTYETGDGTTLAEIEGVEEELPTIDSNKCRHLPTR